MPGTKAVFAVNPGGELFVMARAVMHPLIPLIDGLTLHFFGKGKREPAYLDIDTAIAWVETECREDPAYAYGGVTGGQILGVLRRAKQEHEAGTRRRPADGGMAVIAPAELCEPETNKGGVE
jgi:hypothetical protein